MFAGNIITVQFVRRGKTAATSWKVNVLYFEYEMIIIDTHEFNKLEYISYFSMIDLERLKYF